jgi:hypothetical protein
VCMNLGVLPWDNFVLREPFIVYDVVRKCLLADV